MSLSFSIDATEEPKTGPKLGRLVNHGERNQINVKLATLDMNCTQPTLCMFALRDIHPGELLYNYGVNNLPWKQKPKVQ